MNMFARVDENPAMTLQDISKTKRYGRTHTQTDGRTDRHRENSIPTTNKVCGGYKNPLDKSILIMKLQGWISRASPALQYAILVPGIL